MDNKGNGDESLPDVFRSVVSITNTRTGAVVILECNHAIPAFPYWKYHIGDLHICHRCSAERMRQLSKAERDDT